MRTLRLALAAVLVAACGSPPPPPRRAAPAAVAPKVSTDEDIKPIEPSNIYVYSPIGKRDPFQNTLLASAGVGRGENKGRAKTPLEKWPLDNLRLSLTVTGTANPMAMVEDPENRGWTVRIGDFIGQNGGKVTGIHRDEIVITETITDHSTGRVYPQNVKLMVKVSQDEDRDLRALREGEQLGPARGD